MTTQRLYFDNAATSFPKPPEVLEAMIRYATEIGASPGRGAYAEAVEAGRVVDEGRARLNRLIGGAAPERIIFTLNATDALNLAIKGLVTHHRRREPGCPVHVVTTWMDHNSVLRPFHALAADEVEQTRVKCDPATGLVDPEDVRRAIRADTRLVACVHGSNVTGTVQPLAQVSRVCREKSVPLLVDAAQTLGHMPVNVSDLGIDLLAFPGHKGLLGPLGTGGLYIGPGLESIIDPLREGGTGSVSEQAVQPDFLPDKYEPGSPNGIGIAGLSAGVAWILGRGIEKLHQHERRLVKIMLETLDGAPGVRVLGPTSLDDRCGVVSVVADGLSSEALAAALERDHGVLSRPGLHCAPLAHRTMGTCERGGATRLSVGPFLTEADAGRAARAVRDICRDAAAVPA